MHAQQWHPFLFSGRLLLGLLLVIILGTTSACPSPSSGIRIGEVDNPGPMHSFDDPELAWSDLDANLDELDDSVHHPLAPCLTGTSVPHSPDPGSENLGHPRGW